MKLDKANFTYEAINLKRGVYQFTAFHPHCTAPIGIVWALGIGDVAFIFDSYVPKYARRQGVRTYLNERIQEWCPKIVTALGSKEGGMAFLKAQNYSKIKELNWYLKSKKVDKSSKKV
jgi:hypothetical protein